MLQQKHESEDPNKQQYLFYSVGGLSLATSFLFVKEIINLRQSILSVPNVPPHVSGIINLRGNVLAIVNLTLLHSPQADFGGQASQPIFSHILVVKRREVEVGLLIDEIPQIASISPEDIQPLSHLKVENLVGFITGEYEFEGVYYGVLDVEKVLSAKNETTT